MSNAEMSSGEEAASGVATTFTARAVDSAALHKLILQRMQAHSGAAHDLDGLAAAIAGLASQDGSGMAGFEHAWRAALLAGVPAQLAAEGLYAWLAALSCKSADAEELAANQQLALQAAGRAMALVRQTVASGDPQQALDEILRAALPGVQTGVLMLGLPAFLEGATGSWTTELTQAVVARLRPDDWLLQISPRDWLLLMPGLRSAAQLPLAAQALSAACTSVLAPHFGVLQSGIRVGAALAPVHGVSARELLNAARTALQQARVDGDVFCQYEPRDDAHDDQALGLEFSRALQANALLLHYQPQVRLAEQGCVAVEALLRWRNAEGIWVSPPRMLALAERLGLLPRLCDWLIAEACRQAAVLAEAGFPVRVAINLTARDFYDVDLPERVRQLSRTWGVRPQQLLIEVTETTLIAQPKRAFGVFAALRSLGCRISLDDFGTGYSSLAYLRELPVDEIKIDRCFVADVLVSERAAAIVRSVIALGRGLGLNVVAEGAENDAVIAWLRNEGCAVVQGFGFARPMSSEALLAWLAASVRA